MHRKYLTIEWDSGKTMTFNNANDLRVYLFLIHKIEMQNAEIEAVKEKGSIPLETMNAKIVIS